MPSASGCSAFRRPPPPRPLHRRTAVDGLGHSSAFFPPGPSKVVAVPYASPADAAHAAAFFDGREEARRLWDGLVEEAQGWGPVRVTATRVRVCLLARTRFLYCPVAHARGSIIVRFLLPYRIGSPRLRVDAAGGRWSHRVTLSALDDEALGWFRAALEADAEAER